MPKVSSRLRYSDRHQDTGHRGPMQMAENHTGHVAERGRVLRIWQKILVGQSGHCIEFMRFGGDGLRPLVWLQSLDYPMAPPWGLCVDAAEAGYGIISVRRPGFGDSADARDVDEEARLLSDFLEALKIEDAILIIEGTARRAGLKLALASPRVGFTVLARPAYSYNGFGDVEPWMANLILQALQSWAGARLSLTAIKQFSRSSGDNWLYQHFFKRPSDAAFIKSHRRDVAEALNCLRGIEAETFRRELGALAPDDSLIAGYLAELPCLAVIGADTHPDWRAGFEARSADLGVATAILPQGSYFALYQNSTAFLQLLREAC